MYLWWHSGWGTALQTGRSLDQFPIVSLEFFIDIILSAALWPWGRLNLQQKWLPKIFPGGKGGRFVGLTTLPPSCADYLKIWEPQPTGTLKACNRIACLPASIANHVMNKNCVINNLKTFLLDKPLYSSVECTWDEDWGCAYYVIYEFIV
jgi:hypothetical protein